MTTIPNFQILALNDAQSSENRIHSDEIAAKKGFAGDLVSGVNVFGYLSQPLVQYYKIDWLSRGIMEIAFIKPAYENNLLTIETEDLNSESSQRNHHTFAYNEDNVLIAKLESSLPDQLPPINVKAQLRRNPEELKRNEISWDAITLNEPTPAYLWQPTASDNMENVTIQRDQSNIYNGESGLLHPFFILNACNKALMRQFLLPAWIHTGSRLTLRKSLRVGQSIEVRAVPTEKWKRKGHQFIKLYISMWTDNEVALEVEHTANFSIAA